MSGALPTMNIDVSWELSGDTTRVVDDGGDPHATPRHRAQQIRQRRGELG
ncbi:MAG: hypothetical protein HC863_02055, partial [Myxococcales bacterium]|nr:hypothetical protein [Myxococcales bacterium]